MDILKSTFINEATELLQELDVALLMLENSPTDQSGVEYVFRVMHTLKGNSKMFDFQKIAEIVHDLESVYEIVREGKLAVSKNLLDCTFQALDHLKCVLEDPECVMPANAVNHQNLLKKFRELAQQEQVVITQASSENSHGTYHIFFKPNKEFLQDGSNPLYILEDLAQLGKTLMVAHVSSFEASELTQCHIYWDIFLESTHPVQAIRDVFVFAESSAQIDIKDLPYTGVVHSPDFAREVKKTSLRDIALDSDQIIHWAQTFGNPVVKAESKSVSKPAEKAFSSVRVGSEKLEELMNLVSEFITTQARLSLFAESSKSLELENITEIFEKLSRRLRDVAFGMTLIPINNLFNRFQRMVRDISSELGKDVRLISLGGETELDKNIIESLADPLMHIIRNSVDHGIELPEDRTLLSKPKSGKITLKAYYSGVFIYIEISDDGRGLDLGAIKEKAIKLGIIDANSEFSEQEIGQLIFHPGFSTAKEITSLSGRGVGMDVVQKTIASLKGQVQVESVAGKGTTITIKLPLTLSIIDGLLVSVGTDKYLLPLNVVYKCYEIPNSLLINNFNQLIVLDGRQCPFIHLRDEFGHELSANGRSQAIVVRHENMDIAIITDTILGEYQAVVKPLGRYFQYQDFVSGATILGDGSIALILDTYKVVEMYAAKVKRNQSTYAI